MTDIPVELPSATNATNVRSTAVSMATRDAVDAALSSADHARRHRNSNVRVVLGVTDGVTDDRHASLLQITVHVPGMHNLAPSCNVALLSRLHIATRQTGRLDVLVEDNRPLQFQQSDVRVELSVVVGVGQHFFHGDIYLAPFCDVSVVLTHTH